MDKVTISVELANMMLGYLGKRPYEEVFSLIERFQAEHKESLPKPDVEQDTQSTQPAE
jgi:hypothetical protein